MEKDVMSRDVALRRITIGWAAALSASAAMATAQAPAANSYTAGTTYAKLVKAYPFIQVASRDVPASVRAVRDVIYATHGARTLRLDLYLPAQADTRCNPGIVFVHGGGWRVGVRENFAPMAIRMAQRGYAAATISYRLADEAPYPAAVHDVKAAIRWMRARAREYRIDPDRIAVAGGSAGGQIASLAGVTAGIARFDADEGKSPVSSAVQAIINIDGASDFLTEVDRLRKLAAAGTPIPEETWFGGWFRGSAAEKEVQWHEASPLAYAGPATPPVLFIGSGIPRYSAGREQMVVRLDAAHVANRVVVLPDTPHSFWLFDPWLGPTVEASVAFLDQVFGRTATGH
jgi:acetyl esterase/lipase